MKTLQETKHVKPGGVYFADNGRRICVHCAGMSSLYTGRDISGQRIDKATRADHQYWMQEFGEPLSCECGKTVLSFS